MVGEGSAQDRLACRFQVRRNVHAFVQRRQLRASGESLRGPAFHRGSFWERVMTADGWQQLEAISSAVTALSAILISGLAAFWAWFRDRERLKVFRFGDNYPVQVADDAKQVRQVFGMEGHAKIGLT